MHVYAYSLASCLIELTKRRIPYRCSYTDYTDSDHDCTSSVLSIREVKAFFGKEHHRAVVFLAATSQLIATTVCFPSYSTTSLVTIIVMLILSDGFLNSFPDGQFVSFVFFLRNFPCPAKSVIVQTKDQIVWSTSHLQQMCEQKIILLDQNTWCVANKGRKKMKW